MLVSDIQNTYRISERRGCALIGMSHSVFRYRANKRRSDGPIRLRIKDIAHVRIRYGFCRIYILLRREGWKDNHKRVYRIYKEEGLNLRSKRPRRSKSGAHRLERPQLDRMNQCWSMDFVTDNLFDGRRFRALTIVDNYSRKCLAIRVGQSLRGSDVVDVLEDLNVRLGVIPERIQTDNGSEFISKELDRWAYEHQVTMDYSRPGKPTDNPFVESFNGSFRDECLNMHWFLSLEDAVQKIEAWRTEYNEYRPHSLLDDRTPVEFEAWHWDNSRKKECLPAAHPPDKMFFVPSDHSSSEPKKTSNPKDGISSLKRPNL